MRKFVLALMAIAMLAIIPASASAANGDMPLKLDFESATNSSTLADFGATTDFSLTSSYAQANWPGGTGDMWDAGVYAFAANPNSLHPLWASFPGDDKMLIVNGKTDVNQKVLEVSVPGTTCNTAGSNVTYNFSANMVNILPLTAASDGGAAISVYVNGSLLGSQTVLSNDPSNVINIEGGVPASDPMTVKIVNNGTAYSGNDFAIDDITLTQVGECVPPCKDEIKGVWHNYTGKFTGTGVPALNDPKWQTHTNTPGGQHDLAQRGLGNPYQTGKPGNGDWFYWSDEGVKCSTSSTQ